MIMKREYDLYDFDRTVYRYDCESRFYLFCLLRRPYILPLLPYQMLCVLFRFTLNDRLKWMTRFFCYLRFVDAHKLIERFWQREQHNIRDFFLVKNRVRPAVICSESPFFLLEPIKRMYEVDIIIGTALDMKTLRSSGKIMRGENKVDAVKTLLPDAVFHSAYTDRPELDKPLLSLANNRFHVNKDGVITAI